MANDSLTNWETVKLFTGEQFERERFKTAISNFQTQSINVQMSLSLLNGSQQLLMHICLVLCLCLSAISINNRLDCCGKGGCGSNDFECCSQKDECHGMNVGDFVGVTVFITQLFQPLNFLGTVYNMLIMAWVDLQKLVELFQEPKDVVDSEDATELGSIDKDVAIEFDRVSFRYPSQPADKGLKGLSFSVKRGTVTALVGPTGSG